MLEKYSAGERDFSEADLSDSDLTGVNLCGVKIAAIAAIFGNFKKYLILSKITW
ncbi:MAG: pentapeptide repeat-containing protein [Nostoc sp.]|uniref:pentapeptide repeat-containing protein n=1 Tax=Nostoc sp. TaxID=1180 RepID=UPI002FFB0651